MITNEGEVAMELNDFFSDAAINLQIRKFEKFDLLSEKIDHPLKVIVRYKMGALL